MKIIQNYIYVIGVCYELPNLKYIFKFLDKVYFDIWKINYRSQKSIEKVMIKKTLLLFKLDHWL